MLGDQNVSPLYMPWSPWRRNSWCLARASSEIATAISCSRSAFHIAARPIACGKTVAMPARATPCSPSFHQL